MTAFTKISSQSFWVMSHDQAAQHQSRQSDDLVEEEFWQDFAPGYDEKSPLASSADGLVSDLRSLIRPTWHLLEIGAGTGAFTRRLASFVSRITIVEPSRAMQKEFAKLWDGPDIVKTLTSKWEDAPKLEADIVFGANAFYRMRDIETAINKMNASAKQQVALVQTVGQPHAKPLCVTLEGETVERERADVLCDVLSTLNIDFQRHDYDVLRPTGPSRVALLYWRP